MRLSAVLLVVLLQPAVTFAQAPKTQPPATAAKPAAPAAEKKEIKVAVKVLQAYVGEYEVAPERTLTITLEDGSLWGQPTGSTKRQMFAESPTKFFLKEAPVQITFAKDPKGKVTGLTMEQEGRPTREAKKIK
jgi:hypothetical protein